MCLFSIKKEEEEDVRVSRRVSRREVDRYRTYSPSRTSRVSVRTSQPSIVYPPPPPQSLPPPTGKVLPAPQPVPQFESPPLSPPEVHYVHVSPRSSISDHGHYDDYRYERRETRYERDVSPHRDHYEYRYVDAPREEYRPPRRERSRSRARSRSRGRYEDDEYDRTNIRVSRRTYDDRY